MDLRKPVFNLYPGKGVQKGSHDLGSVDPGRAE
jgi:hypothetical protein